MTHPRQLDALILHRREQAECATGGWAKDLDVDLLTPSQAVVMANEVSDVSTRWMLPDGWFLDENAERELVEALLSATHREFGYRAFPELALWRRVNRIYMRVLAGSCAAAFEASTWIAQNDINPGRVGLLIDPTRVTTLTPLGADDTFALVLKSLLPDLVLVDSRDGEVLTQQAALTVTMGLEFAVPASAQAVTKVDALVCAAATRDPWEPLLRPGSTALTVLTAGYARRIGEKALGPINRPSSAQVTFAHVPTTVKRDDSWRVLLPVFQQVWMPQLESLRTQARELLERTEPETLIVCDHTFPETALLVSQRTAGTKLITIPHGPAGVDIDLWEGVADLTAHVPVNSARHKYEMQGTKATVDENCYPGLRRVYGSNVRDATDTTEIRAVLVGAFPFWEQYPRSHREQFEAALSVVLRKPDRAKSRVRLAVKPRPGADTVLWYERYGQLDELIPETTPLSQVFATTDLAILIDEPSAAAFEAISNGCAVAAVSRDPDADRWSDRPPDRGQLFDLETMPVVHPDEFWDWILAQDERSVRAIWSRQADWLRSQLLADVVVETIVPATSTH